MTSSRKVPQHSCFSASARSMHFSDYFRLKNLPISQQLNLVVAVYSVIICCLLVLSHFGMGILSDLRVCVMGKEVWAIARRDAVLRLEHYIYDGVDADYQIFLKDQGIAIGDRKAFTEILKDKTDLKVAEAGFVEGGNNPEDVRRIARLFKGFYWVPYIRESVRAWQRADSLLDEMITLGIEVHQEVLREGMTDEKRKAFLARLADMSAKTEPWERDFDYKLGLYGRSMTKILMLAMISLAVILLIMGVLIARAIARHLMSEIRSLQQAAAKIAEGDFNASIDTTSMDEIGDLARSFKQMALQREEAESLLGARAQDLVVANQKLVEAERIKDEFFAAVSHELRTPLTLVLTPLESLLMGDQGALSSKERVMLEVMHNNAVRLLQMVTGLLDVSKIGAGQMEVKREPTDIRAVTRSILDDFAAMLNQKKIESHLIAGEPVMVMMDRYMYERILFNLLSNAIKFTPDGGCISVSIEALAGRLSLAVSDTGIGISKENQSHLFEKFKQVDSASTRRFEGAGLGLALVKEFSGLLGGDVSVVSCLGQGSTFTVHCEAPAAAEAEMNTLVRPRQKLVQQFQIKSRLPTVISTEGEAGLPKLLIAEDNPELASYLAEQTQAISQVRVVRNGEEALAVTREWLPDLVLSDVMMPERDGLSLCRAVKADSATAHIPVILLTALTHREALLEGWEAGADEYLFKPFHPAELLARVKSVLANSQERRRVQLILKESNQQLEVNVQARTAELLQANKSLTKQKKDLEKVNLELDSFVYTASHDLRTPLRAIASFSALLEENYRGKLDETGCDYLARVVKSAKRMDLLIHDLLTLSRISRIQQPYEEVAISKLLDSVKERLEFDLQETKVDLQIQTGLPAVYCDRVKIAEVFLNLMNNAIKFSVQNESGNQRVSLGYADRGEFHEFCVKDNGIGIDSRYHERIFGLFERINPHSQYGGTGIGLHIVKRVIEDHGGRVWVESKLGEGAAFCFTLPKNPKHKEPGDGE